MIASIEYEIVKWIFFAESKRTVSWKSDQTLKIDNHTFIEFNQKENDILLIDCGSGDTHPKVFRNVFSKESCDILWNMYNLRKKNQEDLQRPEALSILKSRIDEIEFGGVKCF